MHCWLSQCHLLAMWHLTLELYAAMRRAWKDMMRQMPASVEFPPLLTDAHIAWFRATQVCVDPLLRRCHGLCCCTATASAGTLTYQRAASAASMRSIMRG